MKKKWLNYKQKILILISMSIIFGAIVLYYGISLIKYINISYNKYELKISLLKLDNARMKHLLSMEKVPIEDEKEMLENIARILKNMKKFFPHKKVTAFTGLYNQCEKNYLDLNLDLLNSGRDKFKSSMKKYKKSFAQLMDAIDEIMAYSYTGLFPKKILSNIMIFSLLDIIFISIAFIIYYRNGKSDKKCGNSIDSSAFIAGLAHEIKNPLAAIEANLQLLAMDIKNEELYRAIKESKRLYTLLDNYLKLLRPIEYNPENVRLSSVITDIQRLLSSKIKEKNISFSFNAPHRAIMLDRDQVKQLLFNLISNAADAVPENGIIMVHANFNRRKIIISVKDNGPGITNDQEERIFSPFYSKKPHGTGMGLFICKNIVEKAGGELKYSRKNDMTSFDIILPIEED